MTTDEGINYDRSYLDKEFPIGTFEISREMILEFSQASGEVNPIYVDEAQAAESEYGRHHRAADILQSVRQWR